MTQDHSIGSERGKRGPKPRAPQKIKAARKLASEGAATVAELARLAEVSRQLARHWVRDIDVHKRRREHLRKLWRETLKRTE